MTTVSRPSGSSIVGATNVLVVGLEVGTGATSGAEVRWLDCELLTIRDGLIVPTASSTTRATPSKPPGCGSSGFGRNAHKFRSSP